ncbi:MAG: transglutaminaseTgpA domain-containing protein [Nocardioidaceae bacterium]
MSASHRLAWWGWLATVLTSLSFVPALSGKGYLLTGALVAGAVVLTGAAARALRTPRLVVPFLQLLVLLELMVLGFGDRLAYGVLPTTGTAHRLVAVVSAGIDTAQRFAAPAPSSKGLLIMLTFGIGVVAVLVDLLAVGLARVPLAGLPLLALYTVPVAALPSGVPAYAFVPGAAAFVAMLMADERDRLAHWGRLVTRRTTSDVALADTSGLHATGRRVSVMALCAAVVLPVFVPAFSSALLDSGRSSSGGDGPGGNVSFQDPMVSLARSLKRNRELDLLDVQSELSPEYLRLVVLDTPGPNGWTTPAVDLDTTVALDASLPGPTGLGTQIQERSGSMTLGLTDDFPTDSAWLPVPYDVSSLDAGSDFVYVPEDQTVAVTNSSAIADTGSYDVSYSEVDISPDLLAAAGLPPDGIAAAYGVVPADVPEVVAETARAVTSTADTPYEQAVALQNFFRVDGDFIYDLDAGYGYGYEAMSEFLQKRHGFCQHFSATMAMMARTLGIPSRLVVGFLKPTRTERGHAIFTSHDVHSWPELYFEGVGWVRFEPTPGVGAPLLSYAGSGQKSNLNGAASGKDPEAAPVDKPVPHDASNPAAERSGSSGGSTGLRPALPPTGWLIAFGLLILALLPPLLRALLRRRRLSSPQDLAAAAEAAWTELRDRVQDLRLPWSGSMTPRARENALAPLLHGHQDGLEALHRLALGVERARYATSLPTGSDPVSDVKGVLAAVSRSTDRGRRALAFWLPASLLPDLRSGWEATTSRLWWRRTEQGPVQ